MPVVKEKSPLPARVCEYVAGIARGVEAVNVKLPAPVPDHDVMADGEVDKYVVAVTFPETIDTPLSFIFNPLVPENTAISFATTVPAPAI